MVKLYWTECGKRLLAHNKSVSEGSRGYVVGQRVKESKEKNKVQGPYQPFKKSKDPGNSCCALFPRVPQSFSTVPP